MVVMSEDIAVTVHGLGKKFTIGGPKEKYHTFRDAIMNSVKAPFRNLTSRGADQSINEIWALKDVSFDVHHGEVIGIIGRNGAGKSTLLKILSRITPPTEGEVEIHGRVGSLLEVGTGFHPELTGRENIFLSGSILGMRKREIEEKFDEIVKFSEIVKFIDTPVKRYSSGMYVRLAFAVAAHMDTEILLVDEVLAVGDTQFQKKCLGKMGEVAEEGRTVFLVSHNIATITRLCNRTILLDMGKIIEDGPSQQVAMKYLHSDLGTTAVREWKYIENAPGDEIVRLIGVRIKSEDGAIIESIGIRFSFGVEMEFEVLQEGSILVPNFLFSVDDGPYLFVTLDQDPEWRDKPRKKGRYFSTAWVPGNLLTEGNIIIGVTVSSINPLIHHFDEHDTVAIRIIDNLDVDSARGNYPGTLPGVIRPRLKWTTKFVQN